jgi:hypothetical protein
MNNYEVNVYLERKGGLNTYLVHKEGNTAAIYINAHTEEEAVERYKEFMK